MKSLPVGEFKSHFSEVLDEVKSGEEIIITYGKKKECVAVIIPFDHYKKDNSIQLGLLSNKEIEISNDFKITEEEFLNL